MAKVMRIFIVGLLAALAATAGSSDKAVPLFFLENSGQGSDDVRYMAKGSGITAYFSAGGVMYRSGSGHVRVEFAGSNSVEPQGTNEQPGLASFFRGTPDQWRTGVKMYGGVVYRNLYPGIDLVYLSDGGKLKSEFRVAPGADASGILLQYPGSADLRLSDSGELIVPLNHRELREAAPVVYQEVAGVHVPVRSHYALAGSAVRFEMDPYDRSAALVIDPSLSFSTLLGGSNTDAATALAVDASGSAYITGYTSSYNFPTASAEQNSNAGGNEVFVAKLNPSGSGLVYCTYIGGSGDDRGFGIAVDPSGDAYVTGSTTSGNFPTRSPLQRLLQGSKNAFVLKLGPQGNSLLFSTYMGGGGSDAGNGIAIDPSGNAYVVGDTTSLNFPVTTLQKSNGGGQDAFVVSLTADGKTLRYGTYVGGGGADHGAAIAVDSAGSAVITGSTFSSNFPLANAYQRSIGGGQDAFISRLAAGGTSLTFSTYLGGSGGSTGTPEGGQAVALDSQGNAYISGATSSANFPVFNAMQSYLNGSTDAFISKFSSGGTLVFSTYLGGSGIDIAQGIALDASGKVYVAGYTISTDFPIQNGTQLNNAGDYDAFVAELSSSGTSLQWSTYLGGSASDSATALALDSAGNIYVAGWTLSSDFPVVSAYQSLNTDNYAAFVSKISFPTSAPAVIGVSPSAGSGPGQTFVFQFSDVSGATDLNTVSILFNTSTSTASACEVTYSRAQNSLTLATDGGASSGVSISPGSGSQQNSQCTLNGAGSSVLVSGTALTMSLGLTFTQSFNGSKTVYMQAANPAGSTGWQSKGTWTVQVASASAVSVSPSSGSGSAQNFVFLFSDTGGAADLTSVSVLFNSSTVLSGACSVTYKRAQNSLALLTDAGAAPTSTLTPGAGSQQNSQCTLNGSGSTVSLSGNILTLTLSLSFQPAFQGSKSIYLQAANPVGTSSWIAEGSWTVQFSTSGFTVSPSSGTAASQVFVFQFTDSGGATNLNTVSALFNSSTGLTNACAVTYNRAQNTLSLLTDGGAAPASPIVPGSGSLQNSGCVLSGAGSGVSLSGNTLKLTLSLTFQAAFQGVKTIYMQATNPSGTSTWQAEGSWTLPFVIAPVSVSPPSGSGMSNVFSFQFSDSGGATDLTSVAVIFNTTYSTGSSCAVVYAVPTKALALLTDAGAAPSSSLTPGSGSQQNSQCVLNGSGSSVSIAGNILTLNLSLTFLTALSGAKTIYAQATNPTGSTAWQSEGTWTVTSGTASSNLALAGTASESSVHIQGEASHAIDGNTDGNLSDLSTTHTNLDANAWWQEDLGASGSINSVVVWNRTDCCSERLSDYWVFVSNTPFLPTDTPATLQNRAGTWSSHQTTQPNPSTTVAVGAQGRYVRIQLSGTNCLSLAEVQVVGTWVSSAPSDLAPAGTASESSVHVQGEASHAIDGNTDGNLSDLSITHTNLDANAWWQVDLGASGSINSVVVWNRTDCCSERLSDYWVFVSNTPFLPTDTPATLQNRAGTWSSHQTTQPNPSTTVVVGAQGRYVRIQLSGTNYLSLAEVQVVGTWVSSAPSDLGLSGTASESSVHVQGEASHAIDGNTDGNLSDLSTTHTNLDANAWWQVDLGASGSINSVVVWNRTDCCSERLSDYWVFVSDTPFLATDTPATLQNRVGTWSSHQTTQPNPSTTVAVGAQGRYVRIQLSGTNFLSLAEVQVMGTWVSH